MLTNQRTPATGGEEKGDGRPVRFSWLRGLRNLNCTTYLVVNQPKELQEIYLSGRLQIQL